jgi:hypothetical protein
MNMGAAGMVGLLDGITQGCGGSYALIPGSRGANCPSRIRGTKCVRAELSLRKMLRSGEYRSLLTPDGDGLKQFEIQSCFGGQGDVAIAR